MLPLAIKSGALSGRRFGLCRPPINPVGHGVARIPAAPLGPGPSAGATPGTPLCRRPVDGFLLVGRDGTSGGRCSRVSSGRQAWVTYHHRILSSTDPPLKNNKVGHF